MESLDDAPIPGLNENIAGHYATGALVDRILGALRLAGIDPENASPEDLKPVDEFHTGGIRATTDLLAQIALAPPMRVLDIGCGVGGTSRHIVSQTGCEVVGIDLTEEFIDAAVKLSAMVGLEAKTRFVTGGALEMEFEASSFDAAVLIHVGMNIPDKPRLMAEAARVLRPGAPFAIFDIMETGAGDLAFPVPWASGAAISAVATPADYRAAAKAAGFALTATRERRQFALDFFAKLRARVAADGPPPLGPNLLMGPDAPQKIANLAANIEAGLIAPVEMIFRAPK